MKASHLHQPVMMSLRKIAFRNFLPRSMITNSPLIPQDSLEVSAHLLPLSTRQYRCDVTQPRKRRRSLGGLVEVKFHVTNCR
jgi:hypothetical protein